MSKALYAFSGDPITYGHIDIIGRAAAVFDELIVAIGVNPDKEYTFTLEERTELAQQALVQIKNVKVVSFTGLLIDFAYEIGAEVIVKGVRCASDLEYEQALCRLGESQNLGIDTFLLMADPKLAHVSSSRVKHMQRDHGLIHEYVPLNVKQALETKLSQQHILAITGEIGSGKSYVSQQFQELGKQQGIQVHHLDLDQITHQIYEKLTEPKYKEIRDTIAAEFGPHVKNSQGGIDRKILGELVFRDNEKLQRLNEILQQPLLVRIRRELFGKQGIILLNAALMVEAKMAYLSNNHVCLVKIDEVTQRERLMQRDLTAEQINRRLASQYTFEQKKASIQDQIKQDSFGKVWVVDNRLEKSELNIANTFQQIVSYFNLKP